MVRSIKRGHPAGADLRVWARRMAAKAQCPGESGSVRAYEMRECDLERSEPCWDAPPALRPKLQNFHSCLYDWDSTFSILASTSLALLAKA
eukprot:1142302-Pelagomonas_calceolata.AAC.5